MKATEILEREHRVIERVAGACGTCAEVLRKGAKVPADILESIVEFLRVYGDQYHHEEEQLLFSMLREKGVPSGSCPIAVLDYENQKLEALSDQLSSAVSVYVKSDGAVTDTLIDTLHSLAELYPDHIWKEDYLLLPMADKLLSEADQETLAESMHLVDSGVGEGARYTVENFSTAIRLCSESVCLWEQANVA
jgi:hemerythrin-like domain-containing protein